MLDLQISERLHLIRDQPVSKCHFNHVFLLELRQLVSCARPPPKSANIFTNEWFPLRKFYCSCVHGTTGVEREPLEEIF